jgi:hypothetical protein
MDAVLASRIPRSQLLIQSFIASSLDEARARMPGVAQLQRFDAGAFIDGRRLFALGLDGPERAALTPPNLQP